MTMHTPNVKKNVDEYYMRMALTLAKEGVGLTAPNPSVGCVIITQNGDIVGSGHTEINKGKHAEVVALNALKQNLNIAEDWSGINANTQSYLSNLTLYTTLEPCCHYGANPPCVNEIIKSHIKTVAIATKDSNHLVSGNGISTLKQHGITILEGICELEAREIIQGFEKRISENLPFTTLKLATSLDGKIAMQNGESKWITNEAQRMDAHKLRRYNDAILVGIGTIIADDPQLTCRHPDYLNDKQPTRIILDSNLRISTTSNICKTAKEIKSIIFTTGIYNNEKKDKAEILKDNGFEIHEIEVLNNPNQKTTHMSIRNVLHKISELEINNLLVESGPKLITSLLQDHELVDKIIWYTAPFFIGNQGKSAILDMPFTDLEMAKAYADKIKIVVC